MSIGGLSISLSTLSYFVLDGRKVWWRIALEHTSRQTCQLRGFVGVPFDVVQ